MLGLYPAGFQICLVIHLEEIRLCDYRHDVNEGGFQTFGEKEARPKKWESSAGVSLSLV